MEAGSCRRENSSAYVKPMQIDATMRILDTSEVGYADFFMVKQTTVGHGGDAGYLV